MGAPIRSLNAAGCTSLRALVVIALLLAGQLVEHSHSVDHDGRRGDCVVCRTSGTHKTAAVSFCTAGVAVPSDLSNPIVAPKVLAPAPISWAAQRERAPPLRF